MSGVLRARDGGVRLHLLVGWWGLLGFLTLGLLLELLHALDVSWYLGPASETRRLVWRLAHAHGTLFSLVNIAFALTLEQFEMEDRSWARLPSGLLLAGTLLLPLGFLLGGFGIHGGDPGLAVVAAPVGGLLFAAALALVALAVQGRTRA